MSRNTTQTVIAVLLLASLVLSPLGGVIGGPAAPTGTVAAADNTTDPYETGEASEHCEISPTTGKEVCYNDYGDIEEGGTVGETHLSMFIIGESMHDRYERYTTEKASISNLTTSIMTEEAIVNYVQTYNEEESNTKGLAAGINSIDNMSSGWQQSVAYDQTAQAELAKAMYEIANGTEGMSPSDVYVRDLGTWKTEWTDREFTLYNGTSINVTEFAAIDTDYHCNAHKSDYTYTYYDGAHTVIEDKQGGCSGQTTHYEPLNIRGPESINGSTVHAMGPERVKWTMDTIANNRQTAISNIEKFAESYSEQYEPGELSAEEFMSPSYRMRNHATDYNSTGHYSYLLQVAADQGLQTNVSTGFTIQYQQDGWDTTKTIDGGLAATKGTFETGPETGVTYDTNNMDGTVWAIDAEESERFVLNGTFEVKEMRDVRTGETLNSTSMQSTSFATTNATDFKQSMDDWEQTWQERQQIQEAYNTSAGLGLPSIGLPGLDGLGDGAIGIVLIGGGILLLVLIIRN